MEADEAAAPDSLKREESSLEMSEVGSGGGGLESGDGRRGLNREEDDDEHEEAANNTDSASSSSFASSSLGKKRPRPSPPAAAAAATSAVKCSPSSSSAAAAIKSSASPPSQSSTIASQPFTGIIPPPLPHGTFTGQTIFRNQMHPGETFDLGHVSLHHLIPLATSHCFATSFVTVHASWLEKMFGNRVDKLLVIRHDKRTVKDGQNKVGSGVLEPITITEEENVSRKYHRQTAQAAAAVETKKENVCQNDGNFDAIKKENVCKNDVKSNGDDDSDDDIEVLAVKRTLPNWHRIAARPSSGGSLHSKILLFRTSQGFRVVIAGSNLCPQWTADRDCLWVQDFDAIDAAKKQRSTVAATSTTATRFESTLRSFVRDISECHNPRDDQYVRNFTSTLLNGIDFTTAKAELVYSFPRPIDSDKPPGGWPMLANVVERLRGQYPGPDTDDEGDDDEEDGNGGVNAVYATSGSFGDVTPTFLRQMYGAMNSGTYRRAAASDATWDQVPGGMKCLWPSIVTAQSMLPSGVINSLRNIPMKYWREKIPPEARRRIFHDAKPNTLETGFGINERDCHPVVHGKIIIATPRRASNFPTVVYVGSHNFSRAAWGEGATIRPRNIEFGVVLATANRDVVAEWIRRLPCKLVSPSAVRPPGDPYIPASAHKGIKAEWERGDPKKAEQKLVEWLDETERVKIYAELGYDEDDSDSFSNSEEEDYGDKKAALREVVDLCEDDVIDLYEDDSD